MSLFPKIRFVRVSPDMAATNELLGRLAIAAERQAAALEALVLHGLGVDATGRAATAIELIEPELRLSDQSQLRNDTFDYEEQLAAIELLEAEGIDLPFEAYEALGIEPPDSRKKSVEPQPDPEEPDEPHEPEPISSARPLDI